jgi:glycolate oxidase
MKSLAPSPARENPDPMISTTRVQACGNVTPGFVVDLVAIVGADNVLHRRDETLVYECDGYMVEKSVPEVVVFPTSTEHVVEVVKLCKRHDVPFVPRGAGTSLAGGTLTIGGGVMVCLTRMKRILEVSIRDRYAIVESGVVNIWLTRSLSGTGFHYAPDPSSQGACTIGGNVATNSGGPHTLKYGVTVNHIKGLTLVMPDGSVVETGGVTEDNPGYDLTGLIVGNEGTFGIVTRAIVNLTRDPEAGRTLLAVFDSVDAATETVSGIIAAGIVPAALEMLDNLMIRAVEQAFGFGFPVEAGAVLIIEVDGLDAGLDREAQAISEIVQTHGGTVGRSITWRTRKEPEYVAIWKSRKSAFGAIGRLSPTYCTQDGVVPRTKLPHILRHINQVGQRHNLRVANVFHAGDGNIHPILLFDERDAEQVKRVLLASHEILDECIRLGGSVTGEHGIGVEKMEFMPKLFAPEDLAAMVALRDTFNPEGRCNPSKMLPGGAGCIERKSPGRRAPA